MSNKILNLLIGLLLVGVLAGCGQAAQAPAAPQQVAVSAEGALNLPVDINAQTVEQIRNRDDVVLIDVREDWEFAEGHIPGAQLIPLGTIPDSLNKIPKDKTVVAVCRSGNRSNQATQFLRENGFDNVHNMLGGMNSWSQAGYEVEK
ncbi:MAG: rhodanese-like domain-containing protein [Chloroflexi bacterium]|nr:MAG: rhodanese-like domain-containing protein [Chloroflexota bacterium]